VTRENESEALLLFAHLVCLSDISTLILPHFFRASLQKKSSWYTCKTTHKHSRSIVYVLYMNMYINYIEVYGRTVANCPYAQMNGQAEYIMPPLRGYKAHVCVCMPVFCSLCTATNLSKPRPNLACGIFISSTPDGQSGVFAQRPRNATNHGCEHHQSFSTRRCRQI